MDPKELSRILGVSATEAEVTTAIVDGVELRKQLKDALSLDRDNNKVMLEAVESSVDMKTKLEAMLQMMGVKDVDSAIAKLTGLLDDSKKMLELMPELEKLRTATKATEEAAAEEEVDEVIASRGWDEAVKHGLMLTRMTDPAKFKELYPKVTPDQKILTQNIATKNGTPILLVFLFRRY